MSPGPFGAFPPLSLFGGRRVARGLQGHSCQEGGAGLVLFELHPPWLSALTSAAHSPPPPPLRLLPWTRTSPSSTSLASQNVGRALSSAPRPCFCLSRRFWCVVVLGVFAWTSNVPRLWRRPTRRWLLSTRQRRAQHLPELVPRQVPSLPPSRRLSSLPSSALRFNLASWTFHPYRVGPDDFLAFVWLYAGWSGTRSSITSSRRAMSSRPSCVLHAFSPQPAPPTTQRPPHSFLGCPAALVLGLILDRLASSQGRSGVAWCRTLAPTTTRAHLSSAQAATSKVRPHALGSTCRARLRCHRDDRSDRDGC